MFDLLELSKAEYRELTFCSYRLVCLFLCVVTNDSLLKYIMITFQQKLLLVGKYCQILNVI